MNTMETRIVSDKRYRWDERKRYYVGDGYTVIVVLPMIY